MTSSSSDELTCRDRFSRRKSQARKTSGRASLLGRYDLGGQARTLRLYQDRRDRRILELEGVRRQKAKAWMTASVCSGLALILLLL